MRVEIKAELIDERLTAHVAQLARLKLTASELTDFTVQLRDVVGYVDQLQVLSVADVEPLLQPFPQATPFREDEAREFPRDARGRPATLASAPETLEGGFRVPPIL